MRILVTGGGTGGHVAPAIAVASALRARHPDIVLRYVGARGGLEERLAGEAGIDFDGVAVGKLRRSSRGILGMITARNLVDLARVPLGIAQAFGVVTRFRPDAVLSTGGYVCVPAVIAAALRGIPVLAHEQTVTVGLANRIAARFARTVALSFEGARGSLPKHRAEQAIVTGNPVRAEVLAGDRARAARRFGFDPADDGLPCVYVTGGAQGSRLVNRAVVAAIPALAARARVLHQCGAGEEPEVSTAHAAAPPEVRRRWRVVPFLPADAVGDAWALCDLLIGRSGAGTVSEACAVGRPAVFVPLQPASGDEQMRNARWMEALGGAVVLPQSECDGAAIEALVGGLLDYPERRAQMADAARGAGRRDAAERIADLLTALARGEAA
ncbi:MAG: undecaprenyldiphospho-muramoylpentapeptide beta-N-acetylglucosaminyltransferase [Armatimonadota bacterium]